MTMNDSCNKNFVIHPPPIINSKKRKILTEPTHDEAFTSETMLVWYKRQPESCSTHDVRLMLKRVTDPYPGEPGATDICSPVCTS